VYNIFAGQGIAKTVQRCVIISYCFSCKPVDGIFSQFFDFCSFTAGFEDRMLFLHAKNIFS